VQLLEGGQAEELRPPPTDQIPLTSVTFVARTATHTLVCTATGTAAQLNYRVHSMVGSTEGSRIHVPD